MNPKRILKRGEQRGRITSQSLLFNRKNLKTFLKTLVISWIGIWIFLLAASMISINILHAQHHQPTTIDRSSFINQGSIIEHSNSQKKKYKGVFIFKVQKAKQVTRTLCTLTRFFNHGPKHSIRIFSDEDYSNKTLQELTSFAGGADLKIIVDTQSWKEFPSDLTSLERQKIEELCYRDGPDDQMKCTELKGTPLSYVYMGYWRYRRMPFEPTLSEFDYMISLDVDAYLTKPFPVDPFQLMQRNNLTGFYTMDLAQFGSVATGIQSGIEKFFPNHTQAYLDSPIQFSLLNSQGRWNQRSFYGFFFGCRLDFLRQPLVKEFSKFMTPYTYRFRTDEQSVIGILWAMLEPDRVWYLPNHGYNFGIYHQGQVHNYQAINCEKQPPPVGAEVYNNSIKYCTWNAPLECRNSKDNSFVSCDKNFDIYDKVLFEEYLEARGDAHTIQTAKDCICLETKVNFVLRKACPKDLVQA